MCYFCRKTLKTYTNGEFTLERYSYRWDQTIQDKDFNIAKGFGYLQYFGNIASTKLYNRELSAEVKQQNYNAQKSRFGL
jgi:hypothetical protein